MSPETLWYGFVDETGDADPFSDRPLILVALLTRIPHSLQTLIRRTYKKLNRRLSGSSELKAAFANHRVIKDVLGKLAHMEVEIICVTLDKHAIVRPPIQPEQLYYAVSGQL